MPSSIPIRPPIPVFEYANGYPPAPEKPPHPFEQQPVQRVMSYLNEIMQRPMNGFPDPQNYRKRDPTAGQKAPHAFEQETAQRVVYFLKDLMRSPVNGFPDPQNYRHRDDIARRKILAELAVLRAKLKQI